MFKRYNCQYAVLSPTNPDTNYANVGSYGIPSIFGENTSTIACKATISDAQMAFKKILGMYVSVTLDVPYNDFTTGGYPMGNYAYITAWPAASSIEPSLITYRNAPSRSGYIGMLDYVGWQGPSTPHTGFVRTKTVLTEEELRKILQNGFYLDTDKIPQPSGGFYAPYNVLPDRGVFIYIYFSEEDRGWSASNLSPNGQYRSRTSDILLNWSLVANLDGVSIEEPDMQSVSVVWKNGTGGVENTITASDNEQTILPANSASISEDVYWCVEVTSSNGVANRSDWAVILKDDALSTPECDFPNGVMIEGNIENNFYWRHIIATGSSQTKAELEYSTDGSTWAALQNVIGSEQSATIPADTFAKGNYYWRVRTANANEIFGEWSKLAAFSVIGKPSKPTLNATTNVRPTLTWRSDEQQAFRVRCLTSGFDSGIIYGKAQSWKSTELLSGAQTFSLTVQNEYGKWSDEAVASVFIINSEEGADATLDFGQTEVATYFTASSANVYPTVLLYRDGVCVQKITENLENVVTFVDFESVGLHTFKVLFYNNVDGFTETNVLNIDITFKTPSIVDVETSAEATLDSLILSTDSSQTRVVGSTQMQSVSSVYLNGYVYPIERVSKYKGRSATVSCAFKSSDFEKIEWIEARVGKTVCLKISPNVSVTGRLASLPRERDEFITAYTLTVSETHREAVRAFDD